MTLMLPTLVPMYPDSWSMPVVAGLDVPVLLQPNVMDVQEGTLAHKDTLVRVSHLVVCPFPFSKS